LVLSLVSEKVNKRVERLLKLARDERDPTLSGFLSLKALELYLKYFISRCKGEVVGNNIKSLWYEFMVSLHIYGFRGYLDKLEDLVDASEEMSVLERASSMSELSVEEAKRAYELSHRLIEALKIIESEVWPG
jgi:HEPN domain-containing protein